ncbi:thioredoxin [Limosilactobacillus sp.]|uniref:thioredoxin n=1 Tax=Limosilactobacillus sp. TaxID=2773925 RepID=UPI00345E2DAB
MAVKVTTDQTFDTDTADGLSVTDFWATWCGPCRMQGPVVEKLSDELDGKVKFTKLDVDKNQETAAKYRVMSIPTLLVKKDGKVVDTIIGYHSREQLLQILQPYM